MIILFSTVCHAADVNTLKKQDVTILYDKGLEKAAENIAQIYPVIKAALEKGIGWKIDFIPTIYLEKNHENFMRMSGHPLVVGFAVPDQLFIVIDYSKMRTDPFSINSILKHELCHLLLHKNIKREFLPKWLDEGISQLVSGGIADIIMADHFRIDRAIVTGTHIPLRYLFKSFPRDNDNLMLAYAESKSLVEYIVAEYSLDGILQLLSYLRKDCDFDRAVYDTFSISFDELEKNWYSAMQKKATWLGIFINHLYESLFFLAALLLIAAYIKSVIRKRKAYNEDDDDN